ncbi:RebB family R body protein [Thalassomonas actiniarum]|uniref:RebB family R body protein n=1 Tax=Thalassomonas actiniarum TaxID=485447 RepID=A0AAF0C2N7_9GAMM|nr:RebB family R body protein [Thalassomonas actiniarum]WDD98050.1 RebB family R body protein [Thalassomonas actiniarum]
MSDTASNTAEPEEKRPQSSAPSFSAQPTGLVETTFAETLGLSMHNAITNQQSSQMTTSASITNACARLLQVATPVAAKKQEPEADAEAASDDEQTAPEKKRRRLNVFNFLKGKNNEEKPAQEAQSTDNAKGEQQ